MENSQNGKFRNLLGLSAATLLVMFMVSAYVWTQIPTGQQVCVHWNAAGVCDDYGSKFMGIFLFPMIAVGIVALFALIPRIEPRATNIAQSAKAYFAIWGVLMLFSLILHIGIMAELLGWGVNMSMLVPFLVGLLFIVVGNYMGKVRSNYFVGIRTPWTLSSELSWNKTHRLGGKLLILQGVLFMAVAFFLTGEWWIYLLVGYTVGMLAILMAYSYFIWKSDKDVHAH